MPPTTARPWVWWHWMNGNVDAAQAEADIDWMAQTGIGGVFQFEGGLGAPKQVDVLQPFMAPGWKDVLKRSLVRAHGRDMQFGIATSPGWSATGGPWVRPADAMKKLVWSEAEVRHGQTIRLPMPPDVSGPFQDVASGETDGAERFYADVAVVAYPSVESPRIPVMVSGVGKDSAALLRDGRYADGAQLVGNAKGIAHLTYDLGAPQVVRAMRLGLPAPHGFGTPQPATARLEASDDAIEWRLVASLPASSAPVRTASFPARRARYFRVTLAPDPAPGFTDRLTYAPGAQRIPFPKPDGRYTVTEFSLWANPLISAAEEKAGFAAAPDYTALDNPSDGVGIDPASVIDLTKRMKPDGTLDWQPGDSRNWTVLRFGMALTGHHNGPAPKEATGLEVDKLSAPRVEAYLRHYLELYDEALDGAGKINALLSDSIEAGAQNWTDDLPQQFATRQGYDLTHWLPALAGRVVGDARRSDAFLSDFRMTIADLITQAHYGTIARIAREKGMTYTAEALEDHRPQLGDDLAIRAQADIPAGAMWWFKGGEPPKPTYEADVKGAASVAHVLGRPVTAVEALTTFGQPWALSPADMRAAADRALVLGGNRLMLHSSVHQAAGAQAFPGLTLIPMLGHNFNRNEAWASMAQSWTGYLARTQYLLQRGRAETPIALFIGEEAPVTGLYGEGMPSVPAGFDYDFVDRSLLDALTVADGRLQNRSGNAYALLYLGGSSTRMSLAMLEKLAVLAEQGVTIAGRRPERSARLADDPGAFARRVGQIWSRPNVIAADSLDDAVRQAGLKPQWTLDGEGAADVAVQHRITPEGEVYFLVNRAARSFDGRMEVRAAGQAQWWDAVSGDRAIAERSSAQGEGALAVHLGANESRFLVVADKAEPVPRYGAAQTVARADSHWSVLLESRGLPDRELTLDKLEFLNTLAGAKDFAGTAHYVGSLTAPASDASCRKPRYWLTLGDVAEVATVRIGGQSVGTVWAKPGRVEVTQALQTGRNHLEVDVATTWVNRLVAAGREAPDTPAGQYYAGDTPTRPTGLAGQVTLERRCPA
ncbi:glycosyl hydrolase (plasmid) [Novosphingobium resinovorum]|uniref:glycosyl hydrolase n=1 Tax=Novosphingobium TaxID=165696 RepID=UPI001B3C6F9F|nr:MULTISPECIES: glycosyl hydrolase [Novosphingobium]MBF7015694.1 glycoside hydrolase [Novosphingobium sp. HR1a]WJM29685.1 glycosyl hydrolase [Novosphingobium resinovorum]